MYNKIRIKVGDVVFSSVKLIEWNLSDRGKYIGTIKANMAKIKNQRFIRPFRREQRKLVVFQVGNVNYEYLDRFIIKAMNDYYQKINVGLKEEIAAKNNRYVQLYQLWNAILEAKKNNASNLGTLYDDLIYELYVLGYKE